MVAHDPNFRRVLRDIKPRRMVLGWVRFLGGILYHCYQRLWHLNHSIDRLPAIESKSKLCFKALFLVLNRVIVNIDPWQCVRLGLYTRVYKTLIWV